jgi:putative nucleotidyltransferase with HDIG domain
MDSQNNKPPELGAPNAVLEAKRKIRVMFVDDDPMVVRGIARNMSMMGTKMTITVRTSAAEALASLAKEMVDVIITDLYMPVMDGSVLLEEVRMRYPTVLRFVLSGEAKPEIMLRASRVAHQYLSKPCETALLHKTIVEMLARMETIKNSEVAKTISHLEGVPSRQASLAEFLRLLNDNSVPLEQITTSLKKDPGLCARLLKVANSPYFGHSGSIESLDDAIGLLGMDMIVSMAASHKLFAVTPPPSSSNLHLDALWEHCVYVSTLVRYIGNKLKVPQSVLREASTAALLHDIGKLVLAYAVPSGFAAAYTRAKADHMPGWQAEYFIFGNHHAEIGGCLLKLWGLPPAVVDAVSMHHTPHHCAEDRVSAVTLVHIADTIAHAGTNDGATTFLDFALLKALNLPEDLNYWLNLRPD